MKRTAVGSKPQPSKLHIPHHLAHAVGCGSDCTVESSPKIRCSTPQEFGCIPHHAIERFITSGYRLNLSWKEAFFSLFSLHNETINIWTALISFVYFLVVLFRVIFVWDLGSVYHSAAYIVYACSAIYTFGASLTYHWFNCVSDHHHACLLRMDISGIGFLILGSFYPPMYYAFHCHPYWGIFYTVLATVLCSACSLMMLTPKYCGDDYRQFRLAAFGSVAAIGILPIVHLFCIYGFENALFIEKMSGVGHMYLLYAVGGFFYAFKIPERFAPGKFDYWFHSHQFWHAFIFLATFAHFTSLLQVMKTFDVSPCFGKHDEFVDNIVQHFVK